MASKTPSRKVGYHGDDGAFCMLFMLPFGADDDEGDEDCDRAETGTSALKRFRVDMTCVKCMQEDGTGWMVVVAERDFGPRFARANMTYVFTCQHLPTACPTPVLPPYCLDMFYEELVHILM